MSTELTKANGGQLATPHLISDDSLLKLVTEGDCSKLAPQQKIAYYKARCEAAGLDPRTAPFQFIRLQGREILYALKAATDQLAAKHGIQCEVLGQITEQDIRTVTVRAITRDGRQTDEIGCVPVVGLKGPDLANAFMKAVTKAKRRAILSLCGLGMLDETEMETVDNPAAKTRRKAAVLADRLPPVPPPADALGVSNADLEAMYPNAPTGQQGPPADNPDAEPPSDLEAQLAASVEALESAPLKGQDGYKDKMDRFARAKKSLGSMAYYQVLGFHGFQHANEIPTFAKMDAILAEMWEVAKCSKKG